MPFPLATVLNAAPGLISAAADIIGLIKKKKQEVPQSETTKFEELTSLIEQQAQVIEELALNNRNLVLAVRNNRIMAMVAIAIAFCAMVIAILR
jgi:putative N-acetylmannosamine-6-phosphate epimerase